jgi:hypothetical protein
LLEGKVFSFKRALAGHAQGTERINEAVMDCILPVKSITRMIEFLHQAILSPEAPMHGSHMAGYENSWLWRHPIDPPGRKFLCVNVLFNRIEQGY